MIRDRWLSVIENYSGEFNRKRRIAVLSASLNYIVRGSGIDFVTVDGSRRIENAVCRTACRLTKSIVKPFTIRRRMKKIPSGVEITSSFFDLLGRVSIVTVF